MQLVLDQLEAPLAQTTALVTRLARRMPGSTKTCSVTLDPSVSKGHSWKHMQNLNSQQQHSCGTGKEWGNTSTATRQAGEKRLILQDWIDFPAVCLFLIERYTCVLPGRTNLETAVGPSFVIPHFCRYVCTQTGMQDTVLSRFWWVTDLWQQLRLGQNPKGIFTGEKYSCHQTPQFSVSVSETVTIIKPSISGYILQLQVVDKMLSFTWPISPV